MEKTNFENLEIYKLAEELADKVWEIVIKWDRLAQDTVGKQLIRSSDSVGANIAEGAVEEANRTIDASFGLREGRLMRVGIGSVERSEGIF